MQIHILQQNGLMNEPDFCQVGRLRGGCEIPNQKKEEGSVGEED